MARHHSRVASHDHWERDALAGCNLVCYFHMKIQRIIRWKTDYTLLQFVPLGSSGLMIADVDSSGSALSSNVEGDHGGHI